MRRRFLYFLPRRTGVSEEDISTLGLYRRFSGDQRGFTGYCLRPAEGLGPSGEPGLLLAIGQRPPLFHLKQKWLPENEHVWVGIEEPDLPPGPEDLVRERGLLGYELRLGDDREWRVPLIRRWNSAVCDLEPAVPMIYKNTPQGITRVIAPQFQQADEIADAAFKNFCGGQTVKEENLFADACELLSINYRVGPSEVELLGLLSPDNLSAVLAASFDEPAIRASALSDATAGIAEYHPSK